MTATPRGMTATGMRPDRKTYRPRRDQAFDHERDVLGTAFGTAARGRSSSDAAKWATPDETTRL